METLLIQRTINILLFIGGVEDFDIIEYHKINKTIHDEYDRKRGQIPNAIDQLSGGNETTEGEYNSNNYDASDREADGYNARLDQETLQGESQQAQSNASSQENQRGNTRLIKTGADGTTYPRAIEAPEIMPLITSQGIDMRIVSKICGHSSTRITEQIYAKLLDETVVDAIKEKADNL